MCCMAIQEHRDSTPTAPTTVSVPTQTLLLPTPEPQEDPTPTVSQEYASDQAHR